MKSKNFFDLASIQETKTSAGTAISVTSKEMPGLVNISFSTLKLNKGGAQNPIWHPNANKIGHCLQGNAYISIRTPIGEDSFTVSEGEVFFIPKGYVHHIVNNEDKEVHLIFALDNDKPEEMSFSKAVQSLTPSVFEATFKTSPEFCKGLLKSSKDERLSFLAGADQLPEFISSRYKFDLGDSKKIILTQGGYVQAATKGNLPILEGLGILGFGLTPNGAVEPHWHTNAGELIYIIKGSTRITVLAPDGKIDRLEVNGGQGAFAAASHFHFIENVGKEEAEIMAFFSHADPDFIGVGEVMGSYSNESLASIFNNSPEFFEQLKKISQPLVIVPI